MIKELNMCTTLRGGRYINEKLVKIKGLELEFEKKWNDILFSMSNTLLKIGSKKLYRRPAWKTVANMDYFLKDSWRVGLNFEFNGRRWDYGDVELPAYHIFNLRGRYRWKSSHHLALKVGNVLDKRYEEIYNYGSIGRNFMLQYTVML